MMKSLHLKKLAGVGEKMRTWGKSSDSDHGSHSHHQRSPSPPPDDFAFSDEGDAAVAPSPSLAPSGAGPVEDQPAITPTTDTDVSLLDDTPLPALPPLPPTKRRSSVPHVNLGRRSKEFEKRGGDATSSTPDPAGLLLDPNSGHNIATSEKGQKLEDKIKELKLRDLALREERNKERERRKDAERQLKAMQKERYIQGLKVKYLETKLEKVDGNKSDMAKRVKKETQANAALQKEVDSLRTKLGERERALAERDETLTKAKRQYAYLKYGGTDDCSLEELEELERMLEKSRNALLERIKQKVKEEVDDKAKCLICFDRTKAIIFVPCGHRVCCMQCSNQVKICPICRANIEIKQKVFE